MTGDRRQRRVEREFRCAGLARALTVKLGKGTCGMTWVSGLREAWQTTQEIAEGILRLLQLQLLKCL